MGQIRFFNIAGTSLYRTTEQASDVKLLFYLVSAVPTGEPLTLEATWTEPNAIGYYVFPNQLPADGSYPEFEASLKAKLPASPPAHSSFAWVMLASSKRVVNTAIPLLVGNDTPVPLVAGEFELDIFPPLENVLIAAGTRVASGTAADGFIDRFVVEYPALAPEPGRPEPQAPNGIGIAMAMSGDGLGCMRFEALYNAEAPPPIPPPSAVKELYRVSIDPVDLYNDSRTYMLFTGIRFLLTKDAGGYSIKPV